MLDSLSPLLRHLLLMLIACALAWAGTDLVPFLNSQPGWGALAGALVTSFIAWATPLVRAYGPFSGKRGDHEAQ